MSASVRSDSRLIGSRIRILRDDNRGVIEGSQQCEESDFMLIICSYSDECQLRLPPRRHLAPPPSSVPANHQTIMMLISP
ncbi:hypothetical protein Leryth_023441 [Lithospermum erythrorhizon]|nr:hypothetical protein Leryth_023441 [Lithospermum erythrorhizon]